MKGNIRIGDATISPDALKQLAGSCALECFGIVGMAKVSMTDGFIKLLTGDSLAKGIELTEEEGELSISFHVIVAYGVSITAVSQNLVENVKYKMENYTGMHVKCINVFVEGVKPTD